MTTHANLDKLIETKRLILRPFILEDATPLAEISQDPEVMRYIGSGVQSYETVEKRVREFIKSFHEKNYSLLAIIEKETNLFIGFCGLIDQNIDGEPFVELGYRLARSHWNKKLATEAGLAVKDYAFNQIKLPEVISIIQTGNKASIRVAEKLGMKQQRTIDFHGNTVFIYHMNNPLNKNSV